MTELTYQPNCWEAVADAIAENDYCCINAYLNSQEVEALIADITTLRQADTFKKAGIGADQNFTVQKEVRGDFINWLSLESAAGPALKFLQGLENIQQQLSRLLFIPLKDFECHYAIYPPGSFYEKHVDQFKNKGQRIISMACYLNPQWQPGHGGELRIYQKDNTFKDYAPLAGRLILFRSDTVAHAVLNTTLERFSITGWLRNQPLGVPF